MSFSAELRATLGLDTKGFSAPLRQAADEAAQAGRRIGTSFDGATSAHENLLASNHRVARQIGQFTHDLTSGADATQIFASGLEKVERALRLPLGSLAGLAGVAVIIQQMDKANSAAIDLYKSLGDLNTLSFDQLNKRSEEATQLDRPGFGKLIRLLTGSQELVRDSQREIGEAKQKAQERIAAGLRSSAYEIELGNSGDASGALRQKLADKQGDERRKEFASKEVTPEIIDELLRKQEAERASLENSIKETEAKRQELQLIKEITLKNQENSRLQLSLAELAAGPTFQDQNHASLQAISNSEQAREAARLQQEARDLILNQGDQGGAAIRLDRADAVRSGIGTLNDAEKGLTASAVREGLDSSAKINQLIDIMQKLNFANR